LANSFQKPTSLAIFDPLVQSITTLRQLQATSSPTLLHSVSYELKRRFPTALKEAGYKSILEYLHGAQEHGILEITDDDSGSIYVQLITSAVLEVSTGPFRDEESERKLIYFNVERKGSYGPKQASCVCSLRFY
jgi:hypothetical protein